MPDPKACKKLYEEGTKEYQDCVSYTGKFAKVGGKNKKRPRKTKGKMAQTGGGGY